MTGRTHIAIDTDVLHAQSSTLAQATSTLGSAAAAASGNVPASAFGVLASSILVPAVNGLADQAARLLTDAGRVTAAMQRGVDTARAAFDDVEGEAVAVMREYEP